MHKWSESLHFVQTMNNRTCRRGTKSNRCKAMLVLPMNADLKTSYLPDKASSTSQLGRVQALMKNVDEDYIWRRP